VFDGANQGVTGALHVLFHMLVLGGVTTTDVTAYETHAQVGPGIAQCDAIFACVMVRLDHLNEVQMGALLLFETASENQPDQPFWDMES